MSPSPRARGLTLVELLVVLGLLSAFSFMAFQLLAGGLSVWKVGEESRDLDERARAVLDLVRADIAQTDPSSLGRFLVEETGEGARLRLVRTLGASEEARLRASAARGGAELRPSVGLCEVAYAWESDPAAGDPAVGVVRRAVAPIVALGDPDSLFAKDAFAPGGPFDDRAADVAGGVLRLGFSMPGADDGDARDEWDSSASTPPGVPRIPRRVTVFLHLEREERDRRVVRLATPADAGATRLELDDARPMKVSAGDLLKVGTEWVVAASAEPRALFVSRRGALGTAPRAQAAGAVLHRGRAFSTDVPIDAHRRGAPPAGAPP